MSYLIAGDVIRLTGQVADNDEPVDITGGTLHCAIAKKGTITALVSKSTSDGITVTDAATGQFDIRLETTDTAGFSGTYRIEVEYRDAAGDPYTVVDDELLFKRGLINA